ncbi:hypothetical protein SAMN04489835_0058 [Mycolicibacterium rutilum]|uniref:Uncharacterized protein n=1 Tax=Mycolicibacterium rutilum TaxID=370526 RepID=A0A1H6IA36_MYCRU|nr:hypothetical protein [Mycolicibacterium rutilum]SEH46104.1 hypothetical protein SAMN04489835_0058 [Mycolicibacterium rutilum]
MPVARQNGLTTGLAVMSAGVIALSPLVVMPPQPPVDVAAVSTVRTVTADVELVAFADALIAALPEVGQRLVEFAGSTLPQLIQAHVAAGEFAHLGVLALNIALGWPVIDALAPVLGVFESELPPPFGTSDGVVMSVYRLATVLPNLIADLALEVAEVIDGVDTPGGLVPDLIQAVTLRVNNAVEYFQDLIGAFGVVLPIADLVPPEAVPQARQEVATPDVTDPLPAPDEFSLPAATVTVSTSTPDEVEPEATEAPVADDAEETTAPNGATDLSDGNRVEPGDVVDEPSDETDGADVVEEVETETPAEDEVDAPAKTGTETAADEAAEPPEA